MKREHLEASCLLFSGGKCRSVIGQCSFIMREFEIKTLCSSFDWHDMVESVGSGLFKFFFYVALRGKFVSSSSCSTELIRQSCVGDLTEGVWAQGNRLKFQGELRYCSVIWQSHCSGCGLLRQHDWNFLDLKIAADEPIWTNWEPFQWGFLKIKKTPQLYSREIKSFTSSAFILLGVWSIGQRSCRKQEQIQNTIRLSCVCESVRLEKRHFYCIFLRTSHFGQSRG